MLAISKIAELKLLTHGMVDDSAEASCIERKLVNPQLELVFCHEFASQLTGFYRRGKEIGRGIRR